MPDTRSVGGAHPTISPRADWRAVRHAALPASTPRLREWAMRRDLRGGDLLEDRDQPRDVRVERLQLAEPQGLCRHRPPLRVVGHVVERGDQLVLGVGRRQDVAVAAVGHQLAGPVLRGGDHGQAAGQGFEDDERARVVIRRLDEEVARPVAVATSG